MLDLPVDVTSKCSTILRKLFRAFFFKFILWCRLLLVWNASSSIRLSPWWLMTGRRRSPARRRRYLCATAGDHFMRVCYELRRLYFDTKCYEAGIWWRALNPRMQRERPPPPPMINSWVQPFYNCNRAALILNAGALFAGCYHCGLSLTEAALCRLLHRAALCRLLHRAGHVPGLCQKWLVSL